MQAATFEQVITEPIEYLKPSLTVHAPARAFHVSRPDPQWNLATRVAFRFLFVYFGVFLAAYCLPSLPFGFAFLERYSELWMMPGTWVGHHVLHLSREIPVSDTSSGDRTADYLFFLCSLGLSLAATVVWSLLDHKRANYGQLFRWMRFAVRTGLGATLMVYGAAKLIPSQMPALFPNQLLQSYGDSSPMALLWNFMGASRPYEMFAGSTELLAAVLLFVPGCATLGALVSIGVMTNVFLLNMCYDVPVKLFSFHLLLLSFFLVAPDARRLAGLFLLRKDAELKQDPPLFQRKKYNRALLAAQLAFGSVVLILSLAQSHMIEKMFREMPQQTPYFGAWSVEEYTIDGKLRPPLLTDESRWQRVSFQMPQHLSIQPMVGQRQAFSLALDKNEKTMVLSKEGRQKANFSFDNPQPDLLVLTGEMEGHEVSARLRRIDQSKLLLTSRGFHWINEFPYNR